MDDFLNGSIGPVIGSFERSFRPRMGMGSMVEETVGQGTAEALVEKEEQKRDFDAFLGEAIGVVVSVASEEPVGLHFTQVIVELIEPVPHRAPTRAERINLRHCIGGAQTIETNAHYAETQAER